MRNECSVRDDAATGVSIIAARAFAHDCAGAVLRLPLADVRYVRASLACVASHRSAASAAASPACTPCRDARSSVNTGGHVALCLAHHQNFYDSPSCVGASPAPLARSLRSLARMLGRERGFSIYGVFLILAKFLRTKLTSCGCIKPPGAARTQRSRHRSRIHDRHSRGAHVTTRNDTHSYWCTCSKANAFH